MPTKDMSIDKMSFEEAMSELETIINKLSGGDVTLDESIAIYEKGAKLQAHCSTKLSNAEEKIDVIVKNFDGQKSELNVKDFEEEN